MQKYQNVSQDTLGNIIQSATISVWTDSSHTVAATIYSDNGTTLLPSNTVTTDTLGNFFFYAANGRYYLKQTKTGVTTVFYDDVLLFDPAASGGGASSVTFVASGTGAVAGTAQDELRRWVWVEQFGAVGDSSTDDTAAIQAAINTGALQVLFGAGKIYRASGLTQTLSGQSFVCPNGIATLKKNANGVLFTSSGDNVVLQNIGFRGDASSPTFTGDNVNASGADFAMINCGSRWTSGRGVKSTGQRTRILGTCDIYQTTDTSSSGYDIEIGVSGTATLYHQLYGIISTQATGGILATDTGNLTIVGGQFGKLKCAAGTSPSGVNGGQYTSARILGNVTVEISNSTFSNNHFGAIAIVFADGTNGHKLDDSNSFQNGYTVTRPSGEVNSAIMDQFTYGYAQSTFTPTVEGSSTAGAGTYTTQVGNYVRIGKIVFYEIELVWTASTGTGNLVIAGLPFLSLSGSASGVFTSTASFSSLTYTAGATPVFRIQSGGSKLSLFEYSPGGSLAAVALDTSASVTLTGWYMAAT